MNPSIIGAVVAVVAVVVLAMIVAIILYRRRKRNKVDNIKPKTISVQERFQQRYTCSDDVRCYFSFLSDDEVLTTEIKDKYIKYLRDNSPDQDTVPITYLQNIHYYITKLIYTLDTFRNNYIQNNYNTDGNKLSVDLRLFLQSLHTIDQLHKNKRRVIKHDSGSIGISNDVDFNSLPIQTESIDTDLDISTKYTNIICNNIRIIQNKELEIRTNSQKQVSSLPEALLTFVYSLRITKSAVNYIITNCTKSISGSRTDNNQCTLNYDNIWYNNLLTNLDIFSSSIIDDYNKFF